MRFRMGFLALALAVIVVPDIKAEQQYEGWIMGAMCIKKTDAFKDDPRGCQPDVPQLEILQRTDRVIIRGRSENRFMYTYYSFNCQSCPRPKGKDSIRYTITNGDIYAELKKLFASQTIVNCTVSGELQGNGITISKVIPKGK